MRWSGRPQPAYVLVSSGQHPEAVRRTFAELGVQCCLELPALPPQQNLLAATAYLERQVRGVIALTRPTLVLVQGDTLTAFAGARAASRTGYPVAHVEAGLRSPSVADPFPEEWFRRRIARHALFHFAPSHSAYGNLLSEGFDASTVHHVGNTGIDSLKHLLQSGTAVASPRKATRVLVTLHRRENWDEKADVVCDALIDLMTKRPDLHVLMPLHPNPRIAPRLRRRLEGRPQFTLVAPLGYREFIASAAGAALIISDSGGIQEEVPHLGVPLLVPRSCTERPEGVHTGFVRLVNVDCELIVREALAMLDLPPATPVAFDRHAPFGAGDAALRIVDVLANSLSEAEAA